MMNSCLYYKQSLSSLQHRRQITQRACLACSLLDNPRERILFNSTLRRRLTVKDSSSIQHFFRFNNLTLLPPPPSINGIDLLFSYILSMKIVNGSFLL